MEHVCRLLEARGREVLAIGTDYPDADVPSSHRVTLHLGLEIAVGSCQSQHVRMNSDDLREDRLLRNELHGSLDLGTDDISVPLGCHVVVVMVEVVVVEGVLWLKF